MRSEQGRPGRPQSAALRAGTWRCTCGRARAGARWPRRARLAGHQAGSGCGAARARRPQGAPPPRRLAVQPGLEAAGARARAPRARPNGGAGARGPRGRRLGRPGRAVPQLHVRGAGLRQRLPVGRVVPQEPDSPSWSFAGHFRKFSNQHFPKYSGSAIISVLFLKENLRASDLLGMTLAFAGTYLLVNFAPNITQALSARTVQYYFVGWQFLVYVILEILIFCILLYFHKRKGMKHIVILLTLVALLASLTVISVKAVSGMITFSVTDKLQLTYPIFYIMFIIMIASCVFQVKFLNQAMKLYNTTTVVPINHIFFTTSAIIAGIIFYQEFLGAAFLTIFIYLFGCFLSFLGVFLVTRNREKEHLPQSYIDFGNIPGKQMLDKIQPDSNGLSYGTLPDGSDSTKSQSAEKKEV
ncbi:NIPA-like protein 2 isoform X3 [Diceros bicornis minor]|uniref:NIPA-like protein 2 isoform X3 n=1 Tax=Diceros bicornis minor TaxID=77932 RepID=UPI0026EA486E|nr:NIPA-like protein 2 isoform X3 [Diceros bicornis minor]